MKKKETSLVIETLQDWYFIDSVLLNDHAKYAINETSDYDEYLSVKTALLSDLQEFYRYIDYTPQKALPENHLQIQEAGKILAVRTKAVSARMLEHEDMMNHMKSVIKEHMETHQNTDFNKLSESVINERFLKMCLDNILIAQPMLECKNQNKLDDFKSKIYEQSYLTLRSDLIKVAQKYNNPYNGKQSINEGPGLAIAGAAIVSILGFKLAGAVGRSIESRLNRCTNRCGTMKLNMSAKKACVLKCKIQTQQAIISALRQSASQTNNNMARNRFAKDVKKAQLKMTQYQRELAQITSKIAGSDEVDPSDRSRTF